MFFFFQNSNFLFFASCFALTNILKSLDTVFVFDFFLSFFFFFVFLFLTQSRRINECEYEFSMFSFLGEMPFAFQCTLLFLSQSAS